MTAPTGWRPCGRHACHDLPAHEHVLVPFPAELVTHRFAATHLEGADIARIRVDWRAVAYELMTGRRLPPSVGEQTTLYDFEELARS